MLRQILGAQVCLFNELKESLGKLEHVNTFASVRMDSFSLSGMSLLLVSLARFLVLLTGIP